MTFDEAIKLALEGKTVARPHWHWIGLTSRPARGVILKRNPKARVLVIVDEEGHAGDRYKALTDDEIATDWLLR